MSTPLERILRKAEDDAKGEQAPHAIPPGRVTRTMSMVPAPVTIVRYVGPGDLADEPAERAASGSGAPRPAPAADADAGNDPFGLHLLAR